MEQQRMERRRLIAGGAAAAAAALAVRADQAAGSHDNAAAYDPATTMHVDQVNTTSGSTRISANVPGTAPFVVLNNFGAGIGRPDAILGRTSYTTLNAAGVAGANEAPSGGVGVLGSATAVNGTGVYGYAGSLVPSEQPPPGAGVFGGGPLFGVVGRSSSGIGVSGISLGAPGVRGDSSGGHGVHGVSAGGGSGVRGEGAGGEGGIGVDGRGGQFGTVGAGAAGGVVGFSAAGIGVRGDTNGGSAVVGSAGEGGLAGRFTGRTVVEGALEVVAAPVTALARSGDGSTRRLHAPVSPDAWIEEIGEGRLRDGRATIRFPDPLKGLIQGTDYQVFLTEYGDFGGLYVLSRRKGKVLIRSRDRRASGKFGYRIVGKRRDVAVERFAYAAGVPGLPGVPSTIRG